MKHIISAIDEIRSVPERSKKEAILEDHIDNEDLKKILLYAYDPFRRYGIVADDSLDGTGTGNTFPFSFLDDLTIRVTTGNNAREQLEDFSNWMSHDSYKLLKMVINKNLECNINIKTINKVFPNLIPTFGYMRSSLESEVRLKDWDWGAGIFCQEKMDGMFININQLSSIHSEGFSRKGQPLRIDKLFRRELTLEPGFQYHGELIVSEDSILMERKTSNGIINSIMKGERELRTSETVVLFLWDMIPLWVNNDWNYKDRFFNLVNVCNDVMYTEVKLVPTRILREMKHAIAYFQEVIDKSGEGLIIKHPDNIWMDGTSRSQVKLKAEFEADLRVIGFAEGTGKNKDTFGSLICTTDDMKVLVNVSGIPDIEREAIWKNQDSFLYRIVSVKYNGIITNKKKDTYSLHSPRLVEFRADKYETDLVEQIINQRPKEILWRV